VYIISACLLGINCKYNGGNNYCESIKKVAEKHNHIAVCPEVAGGLPIPRHPSEIRDNKVYNNKGEELTKSFIDGAENVLNEAKRRAELSGEKIELAILKSRSPSCGVNKIYDGTFTGKLVDGDGIFAQLLRNNDIKVITEEDIDDKF
jgi:uncharacterized protein YbbK (DUF523 family)